MTAVILPTTPTASSSTIRPQNFGGTIRGALGGAAQRVNRLGKRWAVDVVMPPMTMENVRIWSAALTQAIDNEAIWPIDQVGLNVGSPGTPLVNGASQTGAGIILDGLSASYAFKAGQFISITTSSRIYAYQVAAGVTADGGGNATVTLTEPLRVSPADNDVVDVAAPKIQGLLTPSEGYSVDANQVGLGISFTIEEAR